ncbi:MAG: 50S ribosomal protein L3 [Candidatus Pacebacteria bacterium]|nr:50S ribosomal protein L3 [Candidatus Paceibacterota bacterium]
MKFILGTKQRMTQVFDDNGIVHPATVLKAMPLTVTAFKGVKDEAGEEVYSSVQLGGGEKNKKNILKAQQGQFGKFGNFSEIIEVRDIEIGELKTGDKVEVDTFEVGDTVQVSAISKGKGFQGVVKRHGFKGGRRTHGNKHHERTPGSIGATGPARVFKGVRMAGRMGGERVTIKNLKVLQIDKDTNTLVLSGAVPGRRGTLVEIRVVKLQEKIA